MLRKRKTLSEFVNRAYLGYFGVRRSDKDKT